jgi:hypothetical protein
VVDPSTGHRSRVGMIHSRSKRPSWRNGPSQTRFQGRGPP